MSAMSIPVELWPFCTWPVLLCQIKMRRQATAATPSRYPKELAPVGRIRSLLLVIVGAPDNQRLAVEHWHKLVPHSLLHVVDGNAHNEYCQGTDEFNRVV